MASTYSIYEAKAKLSQIIRMVKQNHRVTITERGAPVAWVVPINQRNDSLQDRLQALEASGQLKPAVGKAADIAKVAHRPGALRRFLEDRD